MASPEVKARARELQAKHKWGYLRCLIEAEDELRENGDAPVIVGHAEGALVESKCPHCGGSLVVEVRGG